MLETLIRKVSPTFITLLIIAMTVGTAFAQDSESAPASTGLSVAILVLGASAIALIFINVWSRSAPDDTE